MFTVTNDHCFIGLSMHAVTPWTIVSILSSLELAVNGLILMHVIVKTKLLNNNNNKKTFNGVNGKL